MKMLWAQESKEKWILEFINILKFVYSVYKSDNNVYMYLLFVILEHTLITISSVVIDVPLLKLSLWETLCTVCMCWCYNKCKYFLNAVLTDCNCFLCLTDWHWTDGGKQSGDFWEGREFFPHTCWYVPPLSPPLPYTADIYQKVIEPRMWILRGEGIKVRQSTII